MMSALNVAPTIQWPAAERSRSKFAPGFHPASLPIALIPKGVVRDVLDQDLRAVFGRA